MSKKKSNQHVIKREDGWVVREENSQHDTLRTRTQKEAIARATEIARKQGSLVLVHGKDGKIKQRISTDYQLKFEKSLEDLFSMIDLLNREQLEKAYDYIEHKRQMQWWTVSSDNLGKIDEALSAVHQEAENMDEDEINALIDEAINEVRREQRED